MFSNSSDFNINDHICASKSKTIKSELATKAKKTVSFVEANIVLHSFPSVVTCNYRCLNKSDSGIQSWMLVLVWYELFNYIKFMYICIRTNSYYVR